MVRLRSLSAILLVVVAIPAALLVHSLLAEPSSLKTQPVQAALRGIAAHTMKAHLHFLADDLLEGRGTGSRGYDLASLYVAAELEKLGLRPAGADGSFFQQVPLLHATTDQSRSSLSLRRGENRSSLTYGQEYLLTPDFQRQRVEVAAPVVFVGFGVSAPEIGYDDYEGVDVDGRVVMFLSGGPPSLPIDERAHFSSSASKEGVAAARGAIGTITARVRDDEGDPERSWSRSVRQAAIGAMRWIDEDGSPRSTRPELRAHVSVNEKGAAALLEGSPLTVADLRRFRKDGGAQSMALTTSIEVTTVSDHARLTSRNVLALLEGSDEKLRDDHVVYSAHLDHIGITPPVDGDSINNGALDNAGGVAALLTIARAFTALPEPPARSILFLAVTAEERGLRGSDYFAHHPTIPIERIAANINLDGFLMLYPISDVIATGIEHSTLSGDVAVAAAELGLEVTPDPRPEEVIFVRSDHYSFVRQGIPSIFISGSTRSSDPTRDASEVTRAWFREIYHTPKDDLDQQIDYETAVKFAQLNFMIGYGVANKARRPAWYRGDFFGEMFGKSRATARPPSRTAEARD
ncbi:MAG TPA: M28 family metallopeptidase [Thermoanaerobaculia bacterium]|nr:M28 family metallopeptidase [Thermoanaerobaculia bacterium]